MAVAFAVVLVGLTMVIPYSMANIEYSTNTYTNYFTSGSLSKNTIMKSGTYTINSANDEIDLEYNLGSSSGIPTLEIKNPYIYLNNGNKPITSWKEDATLSFPISDLITKLSDEQNNNQNTYDGASYTFDINIFKNPNSTKPVMQLEYTLTITPKISHINPTIAEDTATANTVTSKVELYYEEPDGNYTSIIKSTNTISATYPISGDNIKGIYTMYNYTITVKNSGNSQSSEVSVNYLWGSASNKKSVNFNITTYPLHLNESCFAMDFYFTDDYVAKGLSSGYSLSTAISGITDTLSYISSISPPQNINAKVSGNSVILTWNPVSGAKGYLIFRDGKQIANITGTSYTDSNVAQNEQYTYYIESYTVINGHYLYSVPSSSIKVNINIIQPPSNVQVNANTKIPVINITWNSVSNAVKYTIYKSVDSENNSDFKELATTTDTEYHDYAVTYNHTYYYYITATDNTNVESQPSVKVSVYIPSPASSNNNSNSNTNQMYPPKNLNGVVIKDNNGKYYVHLTWTGQANAQEYKIYRGTTYGKEQYLATTKNTYYNDYAITEGNTYYYYVTAVYKSGESKASNDIQINIQQGNNGRYMPPPVINVTGTNNNILNLINPYILLSISMAIISVVLGIYIIKKRTNVSVSSKKEVKKETKKEKKR